MLHVYSTFAHCSCPAGKEEFHCELKRPGRRVTAVMYTGACTPSGSVFLVHTPMLPFALALPRVVFTTMQYARTHVIEHFTRLPKYASATCMKSHTQERHAMCDTHL